MVRRRGPHALRNGAGFTGRSGQFSELSVGRGPPAAGKPPCGGVRCHGVNAPSTASVWPANVSSTCRPRAEHGRGTPGRPAAGLRPRSPCRSPRADCSGPRPASTPRDTRRLRDRSRRRRAAPDRARNQPSSAMPGSRARSAWCRRGRPRPRSPPCGGTITPGSTAGRRRRRIVPEAGLRAVAVVDVVSTTAAGSLPPRRAPAAATAALLG